MLQHKEDGGFDLVGIDNTNTWGLHTPGSLILASSDEDERPGVYWYPTALLLPGTSKPVSKQLREFVCQRLDFEDVVKLYHSECGIEPEALSLAADRLERLRTELVRAPESSLREVAFVVMEEWRRDWEQARTEVINICGVDLCRIVQPANVCASDSDSFDVI
eukprot:TRINITY_DN56203_c0_g1_i2.p1 TRINITY_DN56203_c0_g1~~TRINITY_DN56203_c0_g1_i2.p1  ORF type:complete len:163 (-),score=31.13 TRINITY_DN56203_c0_g1_i2:139-627(-)